MVKTQHPLYITWEGIRSRCNNPRRPDYMNYGGRGITVCKEWDDFWTFVRDMGPRPPGYQIDRIDNELGYSKSNCRWVPQFLNIRNSRNGKKNKYVGVERRKFGYAAYFSVNKKIKIHIGTYTSEVEAAMAYNQASFEWFGDPARLNRVDEELNDDSAQHSLTN